MSDVEPEDEGAGEDMLGALREQIDASMTFGYNRETKVLTLSCNPCAVLYTDGVGPKPFLSPAMDEVLAKTAKGSASSRRSGRGD